jgi:putative transposase
LEEFQEVVAWHNGGLGQCSVRELSIDTQGISPCHITPERLSYWEEVEVNRQIQALVDLGRMCKSASKYVCRITLPIKKDGSRKFCRDYRPLNYQIRQDSFPMPLIDDVLNQLRHSKWFLVLDLQSGFWQIPMALDDVKKIAMITKSGLYEWNVMPFGLKNATSTFS